MKRYCVDVLIGYDCNPMYDYLSAVYQHNFFDTESEANAFRTNCEKDGQEVSKVMDLDNLPF